MLNEPVLSEVEEVKHLAVARQILRFLLRKCYGGQVAQNDMLHFICHRPIGY